MPRILTLDEKLRRYPPVFCRLCCRRGRAPRIWFPTCSQLADASGLSLARVKFISYSRDWDEVALGDRRRFLMACDINLERRQDVRRLEWMRNNGQLRHLKESDLWKP